MVASRPRSGRADPAGLQVSAAQTGLARALEHWTLADRSDPAFAPPGARGRIGGVSDAAGFRGGCGQLTAQFGGGPGSAGWRLDKLGAAPVVSSAQVPVLGYGQQSAAASPWLAGER